MKIYCRYCSHILLNPYVDYKKYECNHPTNVNSEEQFNWYDSTTKTKFLKEPSVLNADNDCKLYEDKAQRLKELNK